MNVQHVFVTVVAIIFNITLHTFNTLRQLFCIVSASSGDNCGGSVKMGTSAVGKNFALPHWSAVE